MLCARVFVAPAVLFGLWAGAALSGCASEIGDDEPHGGDDAARSDAGSSGTGMDGGPFGNADRDALGHIPDAALVSRDAELSADAFFINDPAPPYCGPGGEQQNPDPPGGTPECPDDKNREGCPCSAAGATAPCWPGMRVHRDHGICQDGIATCLDTTEFGLRWGQCADYVLPEEGALVGPNACRCFSAGIWSIDNLGPCILVGETGTYLYASKLTAQGALDCGSDVPEPPPQPSGTWTRSHLNVDCAGQFELCYTIKAGDVDDPRAADCVIMQSCIDVWYPEAGAEQALPELPSWVSSDTACAARFVEIGGYGEMSVLGQSVECDAVDDGLGNPYVFHRTRYCPPSCSQTPDTPECRGCSAGGSGMFGSP